MLEKGIWMTSKMIFCGVDRASWIIWRRISGGRVGKRGNVLGAVEGGVEELEGVILISVCLSR